MNRIVENLSEVDFFAKTVEFQFLKKDRLKTTLGVVLSYLLIVFVIVTSYYFGADIIFQKNPNVLETKSLVNTAKFTNFDSHTFPLAFGLQYYDNWEHFLDESIYTIQVVQYSTTLDINEKTGKKQITYHQTIYNPIVCDQKNNVFKSYEGFQIITQNINQLYCLNFEDLPNFKIGGNYDSGDFSGIELRLKKCSDQSTCKTDEEIAEAMNPSYFVVYFLDSSSDDGASGNVIQHFGRSVYTIVSFQYTKQVELLFEALQVNTDKGLIFEQSYQSSSIKYRSIRDMMLQLDDSVLKFNIEMSLDFTIKSMIYQQVQEVVAEVGGFVQVLVMVFFLVSMPLFIQPEYYQKFINNIFIRDSHASKVQNIAQDDNEGQPIDMNRDLFEITQDSEQEKSQEEEDMPMNNSVGFTSNNIQKGVAQQRMFSEDADKNKIRDLNENNQLLPPDSPLSTNNNQNGIGEKLIPLTNHQQLLDSNYRVPMNSIHQNSNIKQISTNEVQIGSSGSSSESNIKSDQLKVNQIQPLKLNLSKRGSKQDINEVDQKLGINIQLKSKQWKEEGRSQGVPSNDATNIMTYREVKDNDLIVQQVKDRKDTSEIEQEKQKIDDDSVLNDRQINDFERKQRYSRGNTVLFPQNIWKQILNKVTQYYTSLQQQVISLKNMEKIQYGLNCRKHDTLNRKIYDLAKGEIDKHLDIVYIINKLIDVEKMKFLLFDQKQLAMFDFMSRPTIRVKDSNNITISGFYTNNQSMEQKAFLAFRSYRFLQQFKSQRQNIYKEMDQKILQLMDKEVQHIFDDVLKGEENVLFR